VKKLSIYKQALITDNKVPLYFKNSGSRFKEVNQHNSIPLNTSQYTYEHIIANILPFKNANGYTNLTEEISKSAFSRDVVKQMIQNHKDITIGKLPSSWVNKLNSTKGIKDILNAFSEAANVLDNTMDIHNSSTKSNPGDYSKASKIIASALIKHNVIDQNTDINLKFIGNGFFGAVYSFEVLGKKYVLKKFYESKDPDNKEGYKEAREYCEIYKGHGYLMEVNRASLIKKYAEPNNQFVDFFFANLKDKYMIAEFADKNTPIPKNIIDVSYLNLVATDDKLENFVKINDPKTGETFNKVIDYGGYKMILTSLTDNEETIRIKKCINDVDLNNRINKWDELYENYKDSKNNSFTMLGLLAAITLLPHPDNETCIKKFYKDKEIKNLNTDEKNLFAELIKDFPQNKRFDIFKILFKDSNYFMKSLLAKSFADLKQENTWEAFNMLFKDSDYLTRLTLAQNITCLEPKYCFNGFKMLLKNADEPLKSYLAFNFKCLKPENQLEIYDILAKDASKSFIDGPLNFIKSYIAEGLNNFPKEKRFDIFKTLVKDSDEFTKLALMNAFAHLNSEDQWEAFQLLAKNASEKLKKGPLNNLIGYLDCKYHLYAINLLTPNYSK